MKNLSTPQKLGLTGAILVLLCAFAWTAVATTKSAKQPAKRAAKATKQKKIVKQAFVGKQAPDFTLPDSNAIKQTLSKYKGKFVVLEWLNHGCPFVVKHYQSGNMQKLQKKYTKKGVVWLSIVSSAPGRQGHCDGKKANAMSKQKKAHPTAVLLDPSGNVGRLYGARTTPHMFGITPKGVIFYEGAIDSIRSANPADTKKAKNYVSMALDQAMAGKPVKVKKTRPYGCSVKYAH